MKSVPFCFTLMVLVVASCGQSSPKISPSADDTLSVQRERDVVELLPLDYFDWAGVNALKDSVICALKDKSLPEDKLVMEFLKQHAYLADRYCERLFNHPDYSTLSGAYRLGNNEAITEFIREVNCYGFDVDQNEGMMYLYPRTAFMRATLLPYVGPLSKEFIEQYTYLIDNECCRDGALKISTDEVLKRVLFWSEFSERAEGLAYQECAVANFRANLYYLFYGLDNTPAYDEENKAYDQLRVELMRKVIAEQPTSKAAAAFIPFLSLLESEGYRMTENVWGYLRHW